MANKDYDWDASAFFERLTEGNKLARQNGFTFCRVSGLDGFEEALANMQNSQAFVCVSELSQGYTTISPSPRTRRVKTVFLAMRHPIDDMLLRQQRFDTMRELFRQNMANSMVGKSILRGANNSLYRSEDWVNWKTGKYKEDKQSNRNDYKDQN